MKAQEKRPARKKSAPDYVKKRIIAIYGDLSPAERAELLASAERLAGRIKIDPKFYKSTPTGKELPLPKPGEEPEEDYPIVKGKILVDVADEVTLTPRGKKSGNKFFHMQIRCPNTRCQAIFYVPKIRLGRTTACPFCGQHVRVK